MLSEMPFTLFLFLFRSGKVRSKISNYVVKVAKRPLSTPLFRNYRMVHNCCNKSSFVSKRLELSNRFIYVFKPFTNALELTAEQYCSLRPTFGLTTAFR